jgi:hypothetical protein
MQGSFIQIHFQPSQILIAGDKTDQVYSFDLDNLKVGIITDIVLQEQGVFKYVH